MKRLSLIAPILGLVGVLATGCGDFLSVKNRRGVDNYGEQNAPAFADARAWPESKAKPHDAESAFQVNSQDEARAALASGRELIKLGDSYRARQKLVAVERFVSDDLRRVVDGIPLINWDGGEKDLEGNAISFLGFVDEMYANFVESDPAEKDKTRYFKQLLKSRAMGNIYSECKKTGEKPFDAIRKRYFTKATSVENVLGNMQKIREQDSRFEETLQARLILPTKPVEQIGLVAQPMAPVTNSQPTYVPSTKKYYDPLNDQGWLARYKERHPTPEAPKNPVFNYGSPTDNRVRVLAVSKR